MEEQKENNDLIKNRIQKITEALYRVTDLFSDKEPLKWSLRAGAIELFEFLLLGEGKEIIDAKSAVNLANKLIRILELASSSSSFVSSINFEVLKREYFSLADSLEKQLESKKQEIRALPPIKELLLSTAVPKSDSAPVSISLSTESSKSNGHSPNEQNKSNGQPLSDNEHNGHQLTSGDKVIALAKIEPIITPIASWVSEKKILNEDSANGQQVSPLKERQRKVLSLIKSNEWISIRELADSLPAIGEKSIQRDLLEMTASGIIKKIGDKRWRKYSLV